FPESIRDPHFTVYGAGLPRNLVSLASGHRLVFWFHSPVRSLPTNLDLSGTGGTARTRKATQNFRDRLQQGHSSRPPPPTPLSRSSPATTRRPLGCLWAGD